MSLPSDLTPDLLAPGDGKSLGLNPADFMWRSVRSVEDPAFQRGYDALWAEFGPRNEMEQISTLAGRFSRAPQMIYEMIVVSAGDQLAAVRDHTAIWAGDEVIVHLSHNLVLPEFRRGGLAGWLRAAPILTARECATFHKKPDAPILLLAEMEYDDGKDPISAIRLKAYERAGFQKADPSVVKYFQPDFRSPEQIDATGGARPLPFQLLLREPGHESATSISSSRLRKAVTALYEMYGPQFRERDMQHPDLSLEKFHHTETAIPLFPPTA